MKGHGLQWPVLVSLEEKFNTRTEEARSIATLKLTLSQRKPGNAVALKLAGKGWHVAHAPPIKDSEFQLKRGRVTITQWVPNNKWFMVPSPAVKVEQSAVYAREGRHDVSATFLAEHNMLLRRSRLTSTLHSGPDREYKAVAALDSLSGVTLTARAKLRNRVLHSLAASVNERAGTVLAVKSKPFQGTKLTAVWDPRRDVVQASLEYDTRESGNRSVLTADATLPLHGGKKPVLVLGLKWHF